MYNVHARPKLKSPPKHTHTAFYVKKKTTSVCMNMF